MLMSYSTYLSFYLLMKLEGKDVQQHPVLFKLTNIKTLIDQLQPLDEKLEKRIDSFQIETNPKPTRDVKKQAKQSEDVESIESDDEMYGEEGEAEMSQNVSDSENSLSDN